MRPLRLMMQAFGPYAGSEIIDFSQLGNRTMFVISGKTGAGKTTIFDGISYAIYGKASGEDRNGQELRSQFAADDHLSEVSLEFMLRGKLYYIWRSPQQERKKKSGEGTTTVTAKAELYEVKSNDEKKLLGANVREVDEKIKSIIGIDANQFRQILMIPQGEFRKLLTSESKEKEQILQRLFHTELYKTIEDKLKEEVTELKKLSEKSKLDRIRYMKEIIASDNEELIIEINQDEPTEQKVLPLLEKQIINDELQLVELQTVIEKKQKSRDSLKEELFRAEEQIKRFLDLEKLTIEKEKLEAVKVEIDQLKIQISNAYKAANAEKQEQFYLRIGNQVKELQMTQEQLEKELKQSEEKKKKLQMQYDEELAKSDKREEASVAVHQLQQLKESVENLTIQIQKTSQLEKQWQQTASQMNKAETDLSSLEKEEDALNVIKQESEQAAIQIAALERQKDLNDQILFGITKLIEVTTTMNQAKQALDRNQVILATSVSKLENEKQQLDLLNKKWRESQAGLLAQMLVHGEACPVCGGAEHPNPAHFKEDMPNEADIDRQTNLVRAAEQKKAQSETEYYQVKSQYESIRETYNERAAEVQERIPEMDLNSLAENENECKEIKSELARRLKTLADKKAQLGQISEKLLKLKVTKAELKQRLADLKKTEDSSRIAYLEENAKLTSLNGAVPDTVRTPEGYQNELNKAITQQKILQQAFESTQHALLTATEQVTIIQTKRNSVAEDLEKIVVELDKERIRFKEDLKKQGFDSYGQYTASKKTESELNSLENQVQEYDKQYHTVTGLHHDLELKLTGVTKPDISGFQKTIQTVDEDLEKHRKLYNFIFTSKEQNIVIQEKILLIIDGQKEIDEKYAVIGHLHEISKGQNPFRITFERYVLAAFLDDILKEANLRLVKMTSGRYQLLRKVDPTRRNIQSGLELSVYDQYTGQERHVKTLSGGESFKAALALALGLADVVQQNAGGISLETMFIDEGFGTLDPESLDHAIETLMDIQSSGRLVGIISHVPELKERIDARLEVIATQKGSRTEFQFSN
ncbi:AAA family ATPase [Peribacillus huizhouensis]|uniref:Nuclease SbcCD subunit C n=1 Tax=Peribacillus huizhouensis TaxID=1501239 RepID=A0ABR6CWH2_9BACI|nr:AAA family ATPase [Peribacillus huizhouensis]MBA9029261.1 exonuclease SbcC [Peribacillus huizhouensis]